MEILFKLAVEFFIMDMSHKYSFERISPTAFMTSLARQFTDIPFAKELGELVTLQKVSPLTILLEARYKAINQVAAQHPITQILELATGFLPRGLQFSSDSKNVFVESDLPLVIEEKKLLVEKLGKDLPNLYFEEIDATALPNQLIEKTKRYFQSELSAMILCEGLLMYLTKEEKRSVCLNVREMLKKYGGVWITSDFTTTIGLHQATANSTDLQQKMSSAKTVTGRSLIENAFETIDEARDFIRDLGFNLEEFQMINVINELSSAKITGLNAIDIKNILNNQAVYVLSI